MDINQIQEHIVLYETALNQELSLSNVQTLMSLYQKAIEYYSAFDNFMFNDFLNRMQSLLQREDIQIVLNSVGEQTHKETADKDQKKGEVEEKKQKIDFSVDEEELKDYKVISNSSSDKKKIFQIGSDEEEQKQQEGEEYEYYQEDEEEEEEEQEKKEDNIVVDKKEEGEKEDDKVGLQVEEEEQS